MELFAFQAGHEILGISPLHVVRVVENITITPVPLTPPCHLGLIYHRGEMFDVVDVSCLLYLGTAVARSRPRIILTRWSDRRLALVPDRILGLVWPDPETPDAPPTPGAPPTPNRAPTISQGVLPVTPEAEAPPRKLSLDALWESIESLSYGPDQVL
ncbi:MAG: chemotaxis protein CheW [Desulfobacterales bacterium]